jgi:hypothetical protein
MLQTSLISFIDYGYQTLTINQSNMSHNSSSLGKKFTEMILQPVAAEKNASSMQVGDKGVTLPTSQSPSMTWSTFHAVLKAPSAYALVTNGSRASQTTAPKGTASKPKL